MDMQLAYIRKYSKKYLNAQNFMQKTIKLVYGQGTFEMP